MRFGLVGTGYWARETHAAALAAHPDVELVGVWGRSAAKAEELARTHAARAYRDPDQLFDAVDAVAFAVPPAVQAELAVRAAEHGCHLLLDKPVALTSAAADAVVRAVDAAAVRSIVFFTARFVGNVADWLAHSVSRDEWRSGHTRLFTSIFEPGNPYGQSPWRRAHGALWDIGPHALSLALPMLGPVDRVVAARGLGDAVDVLLHHHSGATSTMSLSLTAPPGSQGGDTRFFGVDGSTAPPQPSSTPLQAMASCLSQLAGEAPGPWEHPCDVRFGREVVAVLEAAQDFLDRDQEQAATTVR